MSRATPTDSVDLTQPGLSPNPPCFVSGLACHADAMIVSTSDSTMIRAAKHSIAVCSSTQQTVYDSFLHESSGSLPAMEGQQTASRLVFATMQLSVLHEHIDLYPASEPSGREGELRC